MKSFLSLMILLLCLTGCVGRQVEPPQLLQDLVISEDTSWSGNILIDGKVEVLRGATLTIQPGTDIAFKYRDADRDGLGDGTLIVKGELRAIGTPEQPIRFRSARPNPEPGDWLEIAVDFSRGVHFRYCELRDSAYTLHAHFTHGIVEDSHIHQNIDGCRIGQATFEFRNNLIEKQTGKGINFRNSRLSIHHNLIRDNVAGIFLFENDQAFTITANNFQNNQHHLRLGDFFTNDVSLQGNWWGSSDLAEIAPLIYDRKLDPEIGQVTIAPVEEKIFGAGPRRPLAFVSDWRYQAEGFVDATPLVTAERIFYPAWDGRLHALNSAGKAVWVSELGDISDATPAADKKRIFVQSWQRQVLAIDQASGAQLWSFEYPESPADDHRQGGLLLVDGQLLVPAWNGILYSLNPDTGEVLWKYSTNAALRAAPLVREGRLFLPDTNGVLHCLSLQGARLWQQQLGASLLTTPAAASAGIIQLTKKGDLIALSEKGEEQWRVELKAPCFYGAPVHAAAVIFLGTATGSLYAIDAATGDMLWEQQTAGAVYATPLVTGGRLFVGDNAGHLFAVSTADGRLLGKAVIGEPLQSTPVIFAGRLLVGSRDRAVHAFRVEF